MKNIEKWESLSKAVYWDRDVRLDVWQEGVYQGHPSYLPEAVYRMTQREFVFYYGIENFKKDWPLLRSVLPAYALGRAPLYDTFWSQLMGAGLNLKPTKDFYTMPESRRQFLIYAYKNPGHSIEEIADALKVDFNDAYEHAVVLINEGKLQAERDVEGGTFKECISPGYGPPLRPYPDSGRLVEPGRVLIPRG